MHVSKKSHMFIEVNQADKRYYKSHKAYKTFEYARARVVVGKLDGNDNVESYETCGTSCRRNTTLEHEF